MLIGGGVGWGVWVGGAGGPPGWGGLWEGGLGGGPARGAATTQ